MPVQAVFTYKNTLSKKKKNQKLIFGFKSLERFVFQAFALMSASE